MQLDSEFVRSYFPAFKQSNLTGWAHFENAGGSFMCSPVIEALNSYYLTHKVQPYHAFPAALEAGKLMDSAKSRLADMLNVATSELHFGPSTSQNTYNLSQAFAETFQAGDEIIVTNQDHEANIGAWCKLESRGLVIKKWRIDAETGELKLQDLAALLTDKTKAVAFTHCSNILGSTNPVREITDLIHTTGAIAVVDGVSYCGHGLPDVKALGADIYLLSLYKVYGPHLGAMVLSNELNERLSYQGHYFNNDKSGYRFTPAGPDHAQIASVNGMVDYIDAVYEHHFLSSNVSTNEATNDSPSVRANKVLQLFQHHEHKLIQPLLDFIDSHDQLQLIGQTDATMRAPTVSFRSEKYDPLSLTKALANEKIMVGSGHFYSYRLLESLGVNPNEGVCRASLVHYNTSEEVSRLISALKELHEI